MSRINEGDKVRYVGRTTDLIGHVSDVKKIHRDVGLALVVFDGWCGPNFFALEDLDVVDNKQLPLPG